MRILCLSQDFTVCQISSVPHELLEQEYTFLAKTKDELSLVCPTALVPKNTLQKEDNWRCFYLDGVLDFSLVGILAKIATLLSENGISIFALSTYNTDYVLVKQENFRQALNLLSQHGYVIQY